MRRGPPNPFYAVLGVVGFLFTITACAFCLSVLRGVRPADPAAVPHPLETLMERHGTLLLAGQIAVLAVATVGAVAVDHFAAERARRDREGSQRRRDDSGAPQP